MRESYAVVWQEPDSPNFAGKLELEPGALRLEGTLGDGTYAVRQLHYEDLTAMRVGRASADRLEGRPTLVLERRAGGPIRIASIAQVGILAELAERLAELPLGRAAVPARALVIVPLREGAYARVRELLEQGPPFDPELAGLDRHDVFLSGDEVVFLFEARAGERALEALLAQPEIWQAAARWREYLAGPPRLAEEGYLWSRAA